MNYWYVARPNELFLDIDNASRSLKHARTRLQGAIECGKLDVAYVMQRPSKSKDHIHVIVTLNNASKQNGYFYLDEYQRYVWEVILHGDLYRGCCNIMRESEGIYGADILISPYPIFSMQKISEVEQTDYEPQPDDRLPQDKCKCVSKHNAATMQTCPAAIRLRGERRNTGFFGKPSKNPCTIWPEL